MGLYNFEHQAEKGLQAQINKEELKELMKDDQKENDRLDNLDHQEGCRNNRSFDEQEKFDSGMSESDFN